MNWHADESRVAVVLLSLSRTWHRVKSNPSYPSGDSVFMNEVDHVIVFKSFGEHIGDAQKHVAWGVE